MKAPAPIGDVNGEFVLRHARTLTLDQLDTLVSAWEAAASSRRCDIRDAATLACIEHDLAVPRSGLHSIIGQALDDIALGIAAAPHLDPRDVAVLTGPWADAVSPLSTLARSTA